MRTSLKTFAIIEISLGGIAMLSAFTSDVSEAGAAFLGGALFLTAGIIALCYIGQQDKKVV